MTVSPTAAGLGGRGDAGDVDVRALCAFEDDAWALTGLSFCRRNGESSPHSYRHLLKVLSPFLSTPTKGGGDVSRVPVSPMASDADRAGVFEDAGHHPERRRPKIDSLNFVEKTRCLTMKEMVAPRWLNAGQNTTAGSAQARYKRRKTTGAP